MNYGLGGYISPHADEDRLKKHGPWAGKGPGYGKWSDDSRIITFMLYASDVISGGHTVFPQLGLSVKPIKGSAMYWFNVGPRMNLDSRLLHLGCPVLFGNKWIANKWIKFSPQYEHYKCSATHHKYFSIM